jgi:hypothetical protein
MISYGSGKKQNDCLRIILHIPLYIQNYWNLNIALFIPFE